MPTEPDTTTFEAVDWSAYDPSGRIVSRRTVAFLVCLAAILTLYVYDFLFVPNGHTLLLGFRPEPLDWLAAFSALLLTMYGVVPLAVNRRLTAHYWRRFRRNRVAVTALAYLLVFALLAVVGPWLWGSPSSAPRGVQVAERGGIPPGLPPFWGEISTDIPLYCATEVVDGKCQGTIYHPLGTSPEGMDVLALIFKGMTVALKIALITAAIIVPIATAFGTVAAYYGGRVGTVLMRYVDLQSVVPAFIVYLLIQYIYGPSLFAIVVLFGLLDWGRIARRVRGDALRYRDAGFVVAARDAGATPGDVIRRHIVPNVANTVVAGLALLIPFIIIAEATLSYIEIGTGTGWGWAIKQGLSISSAIPGQAEAGWAWWSYTFPLVVLVLTVAAMSLVGDALHDAIEPRERGENR